MMRASIPAICERNLNSLERQLAHARRHNPKAVNDLLRRQRAWQQFRDDLLRAEFAAMEANDA